MPVSETPIFMALHDEQPIFDGRRLLASTLRLILDERAAAVLTPAEVRELDCGAQEG